MNDFIYALLFFLPAGVANALPPLLKDLPVLKDWKTPIDFGKTYNKVRIFGEHKTWRGLIGGVLVAIFSAALINWLKPEVYQGVNGALAGFLLGAGALSGDAVKSFFKRRNKIKPGNGWFPFDQLDYIVGGLFFVSLIILPPLKVVVIIFAVYFSLHLLVSYIGYLLRFKETPI